MCSAAGAEKYSQQIQRAENKPRIQGRGVGTGRRAVEPELKANGKETMRDTQRKAGKTKVWSDAQRSRQREKVKILLTSSRASPPRSKKT